MAASSKAPARKRNPLCLALTIAFLLGLAAAVWAYTYASGETKIFTNVEYGSTLQNSRILVDERSGNVFLGTYKNVVIAVDEGGETLWTSNIEGAVGAMAYDTDTDWLFVGSQDRNIYVYDAFTGETLQKYAVNGKVYDLDYHQPTHRLLASAGVSATKHTLLVLDSLTGEELVAIKLKNMARAARFTADCEHIVYGDARGRVTLVDMEGEKIADYRAGTEVRDLSVVAETGEILALDEFGKLYKLDASLNLTYSVELLGEGRSLGVSKDGKWIGVGTREGDAHILDADGNIQFSIRQPNDVWQMYFGPERSFIVTLSPDLYEFSTERLDTIGRMSQMKRWSLYAIIASAALALAFAIAALPRGRAAALAFFRSLNRHRVAYLMLTPSIVLILIFNYYNVFQAFYYAFTDWSLATKTMREVNFVGLDNFRRIFSEGYFLLGVRNLLIMMAASFVKLLTVPILLAELVFAMRTRSGESSRRRYWFRLLLVLPMVVPGVVSTLMWKNIFDPNIGAINSFLKTIGKAELAHSWLGDPATALGSIIFMGFPWVNSFAFLVFYGGLINIPEDLFEAAKVDGSKPVWNFFHIHLPLITPQLKMMIILTFIGAVQDYGGVYLLTQGGPGTATYVPGLELFYAATKFGQYGYACAMGLIMFVVILAGSLLNMKMKTEEAIG